MPKDPPTMYAIIEDSGGQLKVAPGQTITVDIRELPESAKTVTFDRVLMLGGAPGAGSLKIGQPYIKGATVTAEIVEREIKGEKIDIRKFRRRKGYRRQAGHRQRYMTLKVAAING